MPKPTEESALSNQRAYPRVPLLIREARCVSGMEVFFGQATNVSRGGLFIATSAPGRRKVGEVCEIEFNLPGSERMVRCRARVVWARGYRPGVFTSPGFGLEFLDLAPEDADAIDGWVEAEIAKG